MAHRASQTLSFHCLIKLPCVLIDAVNVLRSAENRHVDLRGIIIFLTTVKYLYIYFVFIIKFLLLYIIIKGGGGVSLSVFTIYHC